MINNSTKVWISVLLSSLAFLVIGYQLGERLGLLIGFLIALSINFFVFYYGDNRILAKLKATRLKGQDAWGLIEKVNRFSEKLGMPAPAIYVTPHTSINAFCVGQTWKIGSLGFTTGLLNKLSDEELESVIAYQLCHMHNLDTFSFGVASVLANSIVGFGQFLDSLLPAKFFIFFVRLFGRRTLKSRSTLGIRFTRLKLFTLLFSPLGWAIIKTVATEKKFFKNDLTAAKLLEDRGRLGEILWRMEGLAQTKPFEIPPCTSHLFIVNPEGFRRKNMFLKSHPSIEVRLQKLMGYYPI